MSHFASLLQSSGSLARLAVLSLLALPLLPAHGQVLQFEQNLESTVGPVPAIAYSGTVSLTAGNTTSSSGSPNNAKYYAETTGSYAWNLVNSGTGITSQSMVLRNVRFATGSTGNSICFLLTALSNNPNNGMKAADNVQVEISPDYGTTYYPVLTVTGNHNATNGSNGFSNGVVWGYQDNAIAPGSLTATTTFDGTNPSAPATTYVPALATTISANTNNSNVTGAGGYGKVSIAITNAPNVVMRVTMTNSVSQQVWGIDNVQVFSSGPSALPVELSRFAAAPSAAGVGVQWATASEKNSAWFEVQRSADGATYATLGKIAAQGSSSTAREYSYADTRPLAGMAYYRLHQVDLDGSSAFSPVVLVRSRASGGETEGAYPNPTTGVVQLPASLGTATYRVLDAVGRVRQQGAATGNARLDLNALPAGTFLLELTDASGRRTQRLVRE